MRNKDTNTKVDISPHYKAKTSEGREQQLIALAYDLVEQRLREGTATSQETTHFLKLGSTRERKERELLEQQLKLMEAKVDALESTKRMESLYQDAINAVRNYSSSIPKNEEFDEPI